LLAEEEATANASTDGDDAALASLAFASLMAEEESIADDGIAKRASFAAVERVEQPSYDHPLTLETNDGAADDLMEPVNDSTDGEIDALDEAFAELQSWLAA
jgi:hypothetical protein